MSFRDSYAVSAMGAETVEKVAIPGGERVLLRRGDCWAKLDLFDDHGVWVAIRSPGGEGWLRAAHEMVREFFPGMGIKYLLASPRDESSPELLRLYGDWEWTDDGWLRWDLTDRGVIDERTTAAPQDG